MYCQQVHLFHITTAHPETVILQNSDFVALSNIPSVSHNRFAKHLSEPAGVQQSFASGERSLSYSICTLVPSEGLAEEPRHAVILRVNSTPATKEHEHCFCSNVCGALDLSLSVLTRMAHVLGHSQKSQFFDQSYFRCCRDDLWTIVASEKRKSGDVTQKMHFENNTVQPQNSSLLHGTKDWTAFIDRVYAYFVVMSDE